MKKLIATMAVCVCGLLVMTGATCDWHLPNTWMCEPADTGGWDCQVRVN